VPQSVFKQCETNIANTSEYNNAGKKDLETVQIELIDTVANAKEDVVEEGT
jgi:hypothetical protein